MDGQCAQHLQRCIPQHVRRELMKLKLGSSELNVHRLRFEGVAREKRWCPLCSGQQQGHGCERKEVEVLVLFVLHCGSYATLFQSAHCHGHGEADAQVLQYLFKQGNQLELAYCMREMMEHTHEEANGSRHRVWTLRVRS